MIRDGLTFKLVKLVALIAISDLALLAGVVAGNDAAYKVPVMKS
jgi:hypothetical protein